MREQIPEDDWSDQDLLTRDEAAERLQVEIERTREELAALPADDPAVDRLETRITALRSAIEDLKRS